MARICCLVASEHEEVALLPAASGGELPCVEAPSASPDPCDTAALGAWARAGLGLEVEPLFAMDAGEDRSLILAAFEGHGAIPGGAWFPVKTAMERVGDPLQNSFLHACLRGDAERELMPWTRVGFQREAEAWISKQLAGWGIRALARPEHVKSSFLGKIVRIETDAGGVYFKAVPKVFCREVEITQALHAWRPAHIPSLLAVDWERRWMLTREVIGPTLQEIESEETWKDALRLVARMQRESRGFLLERTDYTLYDRRTDELTTGIDRMMADLEPLQGDAPESLSDGELAALRRLAPRLKASCREVGSDGLPATLEHGDLHPGNIRITANGPVILDWAWSSVSHPFLSLPLLLHEKRLPPALLPARGRIQKAYLEEWTDFAPLDRLETVLARVDRWKALQYAVADSDWVAALLQAIAGRPALPDSYLAWTLKQRRYYMRKCWRRVLAMGE